MSFLDFKARLNTVQVAELYGIAANTLRCYRTQGGGPEYMKTGRRVFYSREAIEEWLESRTTVRTSTAKGAEV